MHHDPDFGGAPAHDPRRRGWLLLGGIVLAIVVIVIAVVRIGSDGDGEEPDSSSADTVEVADDRVDRPEGGPDGPAPESAAEGETGSSESAAADDSESSPPAPGKAQDTNNDGRVDDAEALAFAQMLRQRIVDGEDFGELAIQYSDDPGSGVQGGDLGWAGRGRYVPEFDGAAFSLEIGEISQPVQTTFGYHIIEILERDEERPKDENNVQQEYAAAFQSWLQEQVLTLNIDRPDDLSSRLPGDLGQ